MRPRRPTNPYKKANGDIDYRCPAEPLAVYTRKGGRAQNAEGRRCLCNALLAAADFPQQRPDGSTEPAIVTSGDDFRAVLALASNGSGAGPYPTARGRGLPARRTCPVVNTDGRYWGSQASGPMPAAKSQVPPPSRFE